METPQLDYTGQPQYGDPVYHPAYPGIGLQIPDHETFCTEANDCEPGWVHPDHGIALGHCRKVEEPTKRHCWWHWPVTWAPCGIDRCAVSTFTVDPSAPEPTFESVYPPACDSDLPADAIIVDEQPANLNVVGCDDVNWTGQGSFEIEYGTSSSGDPLGEINWHQLGTGFGGHIWFTKNVDLSDWEHRNRGTWIPPDLDGEYLIKAHVPPSGASTSGARYTIEDGLGNTTTTPKIDQHFHENRWVDLGVFHLSPGARVSLSNLTGGQEPDTENIAFDALAFIPHEGGAIDPYVGVFDWDNWHAGDVHVHSAGDRWVDEHPRCELEGGGHLPEDQCAEVLVRLVLESATDPERDLEWMILAEHGPWLGGGREYTYAKGSQDWELLRSTAEELAPAYGIRVLMGEELGTAAVIASAGHYSAYSTPAFIDNDWLDRTEVDYLGETEALGGWGGINHPMEGSTWDCWFPDVPVFECSQGGASDFAQNDLVEGGRPREQAVWRAMEITTDKHEPKAELLERWDELLRLGYRIFAVGGGDGHTAGSPTGSLGGPEGNWDKLGIVSRTYVYDPDPLTPSSGHDATDPHDPVRTAIFEGRTIASTGPLVVPELDGEGPGGEVWADGGEEMTLTVRWKPGFVTGSQLGLDEDHNHIWSARTEFRTPVTLDVIFEPFGDLHELYPGAVDPVHAYPELHQHVVVADDCEVDRCHLSLRLPTEAEEPWDRWYVRLEARYVDTHIFPWESHASPIFVIRRPGPCGAVGGKPSLAPGVGLVALLLIRRTRGWNRVRVAACVGANHRTGTSPGGEAGERR